MNRKTVAVIAGEDAAPEAVLPTVAILEEMNLPIAFRFPLAGEAAFRACGSYFPPETQAAIDASDAVLFGATSGPSSEALVYLRWGKETYANVRPAQWIAGAASPLAHPEDVDFVIVRENSEDLYLRLEGDVAELEPLGLTVPATGKVLHRAGAGKYALKIITERATERIIRFGFEMARRRQREGRRAQVTIGGKFNMLPASDGVYLNVGQRVAGDYPDVLCDFAIIDDLAQRMIRRPASLDVVVLPNLYGDILSDAAAALAGGLGVAPSGCYGDGFAYFEPAHGTAPDIAGRGIINPTATLLSACLMLDYLALSDAATALRDAVRRVYAGADRVTPDQGGCASTKAFCRAVLTELSMP